MKSLFASFLAIGLMTLAFEAKAAKFLGGASGSIESLRCYSTFEGRQKEYVSIAYQARDRDGYVNELSLNGIWNDNQGRQHNAVFEVIYVSADDNMILVIGKSPAGNAIELNISPNEMLESTMKINAIRQDFLKFNCSLMRAG